MELITIPGHPKHNSYITLDYADNYFAEYSRVDSDSSWNTLTTNQKKYALILAAYLLNTLSYRGIKAIQTQPLAFPRYKTSDLKFLNVSQFSNFDEVIDPSNLYTLGTGLNILLDSASRQIVFYDDVDLSYVRYLDILKIDGLYDDSLYLTVNSVNNDSIKVLEPIENTISPSSGVDIYVTKLIGIEENIRLAQAEVAFQIINISVFQKDIEDNPIPQVKSFNLGGALSVQYSNILRRTRMDNLSTTPSDIIYMLLSPWLTSTRWAVV